MRTKKAVIKCARDGQVFAVLLAKNSEPLAVTETQKKAGTLKRTLRRNFPDFVIVENNR